MHQTGVVLSFKNSDLQIEESLMYYIRKTARRLAASVKDHSREMEDCEQELFMELWKARLVWDPINGISWPEYARVVIKNRAKKIAVEAKALKRDYRLTLSIEQASPESYDALMENPATEASLMTHEPNGDPNEGTNTRITVQRFIRTLPKRLLPYAIALQTLGVQETADTLNVSAATVNRRKQEIKTRMVKAGLGHLVT